MNFSAAFAGALLALVGCVLTTRPVRGRLPDRSGEPYVEWPSSYRWLASGVVGAIGLLAVMWTPAVLVGAVIGLLIWWLRHVLEFLDDLFG